MQIRAVLERALELTTLKVNHRANKTIFFKQSGNFPEKSFNTSNQILAHTTIDHVTKSQDYYYREILEG